MTLKDKKRLAENCRKRFGHAGIELERNIAAIESRLRIKQLEKAATKMLMTGGK